MPKPSECSALRVMKKNRKVWGISPIEKVVPDKRKASRKKDKQKLNTFMSLGD